MDFFRILYIFIIFKHIWSSIINGKYRFHITVKGIVVFKQKVLLMKRVRRSLEYGETPNEALKRELKEETGLMIDVVKPAYTFTKIRKDYQTVGIGYLASTDDDHVSISLNIRIINGVQLMN